MGLIYWLTAFRKAENSNHEKNNPSCFSPFGGVLFKLMKWEYWPRLSCEQWTIHIYISMGAHSSSERSQTIRGHFLNFYQGLMQKHGEGFPHRERWFAQFCAFAAKENLSPALKMQMELNSLQGFGKRLNWIGNQSWCSTGQTHPTLEDIWRYSKKNINWSCFWRFLSFK